jgi:hypothetical protein
MSEIKVFFSSNPPRFIPLKTKTLIVLFQSIHTRRFLSVIAGFILVMGIFVNKFTDIKGILEVISMVSLAMTPLWSSLMVYCIVKGRKTNRLLQHGYATDAELKSKQQTNIFIKGVGYIYKMVFQFKTIEKTTAETIYKTAYPKVIERVTNPQTQPILYDPAKPSKAVLLNIIDELIEVAHNGTIISKVSRIKMIWLYFVWVFLPTAMIYCIFYGLPAILSRQP